MKIVLGSPLYPPDVAEPAPYVKELARRLSARHTITIATYGRLPEQVPDVQIVAVDKRRPLPFRLAAYTLALWQAGREADLVYAQNGPSVELPLVLVSFFIRTPIAMRIGDKAAHNVAASKFARSWLERLALVRAKIKISDSPLPRPEILPFSAYPKEEFLAYESSWQEHLTALEVSFKA